jgi:hypothetical protein
VPGRRGRARRGEWRRDVHGAHRRPGYQNTKSATR